MEWIDVNTLEALRQLLAEDVKILGGGTKVLQEGPLPNRVTDLSWLPIEQGLYRAPDGSVHIGPQTTLEDLLNWPDTPNDIKRVLKKMGAVPFRNLATVIGRLANREDISDLYPVMRLYQTQVTFVTPITGVPQERPLTWESPELPEAWLEVVIPPKTSAYPLVEFLKFGKSSQSRTLLNVTAGLQPVPATPFWTLTLIVSGITPAPQEWHWTESGEAIFSVVTGQLGERCFSVTADPFECHLIRSYWDILAQRLEERLGGI